MKTNFKDHFSGHSQTYARFRPGYPEQLFYHLSQLAPALHRAWDCATGTGQSALQLAKYFQQVIATDASANQINNAAPQKHVEFRVATAEDSGIDSNTVELVTVAQALHWFDLSAFEREAQRVLVDKGVLAAWSYNLLTINPKIDRMINYLYSELLDPYWPAERRIVERGYQDIQLAMDKLEVPDFTMTAHWDLQQLTGYLNTWSAVKRFEADRHHNPLELIVADLHSAWGPPEQKYLASWPLAVQLWRNS
ncbi:MAG: class I SAM-dependent methyltransferase [Thioalkalispiraceae bacterium]|jgi:hypothetical protein